MPIKDCFPPNIEMSQFNIAGEIATEFETFKYKVIGSPKIEIRFKNNIVIEINWVYSIILENGTPGLMWERRYTYGKH